MATKEQVKNFINMIAPIAQEKALGRTKSSLPSVCIAQACCESAYGTSPKMVNANAVFGIKVGKSKTHFGTAWKDKAYSTIEEAVEDYYDMLASCSRYKGCINQTEPLICITAIKNGGYATSPTYVSTIMNIINTHHLTQYDSVVTGKHQTLKFGSRGADVTYLQQRLTAKGYGVGVIDGIFGAKTLEAVKSFQAESNLAVDGIVASKTWCSLC